MCFPWAQPPQHFPLCCVCQIAEKDRNLIFIISKHEICFSEFVLISEFFWVLHPVWPFHVFLSLEWYYENCIYLWQCEFMRSSIVYTFFLSDLGIHFALLGLCKPLLHFLISFFFKHYFFFCSQLSINPIFIDIFFFSLMRHFAWNVFSALRYLRCKTFVSILL